MKTLRGHELERAADAWNRICHIMEMTQALNRTVNQEMLDRHGHEGIQLIDDDTVGNLCWQIDDNLEEISSLIKIIKWHPDDNLKFSEDLKPASAGRAEA